MRKLFCVWLLLFCLCSCKTLPEVTKPEPFVLYEFAKNGILSCTAFPVTNRIIITAAHCLTSPNTLKIVLNEEGEILAHIIFAISPDVTQIKSRGDIARDIAIAVLDKEINLDTYYVLPTDKLDTKRKVFVDGYKWGDERVSRNTNILALHQNVLDLDYLGRKGVSGAPITYKDSPVVVGVFSSRNQHSDRGFGALITTPVINKINMLHILVSEGIFDRKCTEKKPGS